MASREKGFTVNTFADEGGRRSTQINVDDPLVDKDDVYGNRLKFIYNQSPSPDLLQQDYQQRLQNAIGSGNYLNIQPNVSDDNTGVSPFPIGCPTGFYQSGNVCIPNVGTYPDPTTFSPPAGNSLPKGLIQKVQAPTTTSQGALFQLQVFFQNTGGVRGKFFIKVSIPLINVSDEPSTGVWVPNYANAVIYKNIMMPSNAPTGVAIPATVYLLKLDETSNTLVSDDTETFTIPSPGIVIPPTTTPPPPSTTDCFTSGTITYCKSPTATSAQCISVQGSIYCPTTPTTPPPTSGDATIITSPTNTVPDNTNLQIRGVNFGIREPISIQFRMVAHGTTTYEGKVYTSNAFVYAGADGAFTSNMKMPSLPSGVTGAATITLTGYVTHKTATTTLSVT